MSVQTEARAAERRANLLAGLNDAPSALTGWPADLAEGYEAPPASPMTALDAMENFRDTLREAARPVLATVNAIMDTLSGIAFPRFEAGDPSQDDVVKGA